MPDQPHTSSASILNRTIGDYLHTLGSSAPTPGGGSAAGVVGALGAGLGLMVISLTSTDDPDARTALDTARETLEELQRRFTKLAERDEAVYQSYRDAASLPKGTPKERQARREAMQSALKNAATIPLEASAASVELAQAVVPVQVHGNPYLLSDARIAMLCASTCFEASRINVNVNLAMIKDDAWVTETANRLESLAGELNNALTQPA
jgi:formiminotetrahydrofolate cyclodeaminase